MRGRGSDGARSFQGIRGQFFMIRAGVDERRYIEESFFLF